MSLNGKEGWYWLELQESLGIVTKRNEQNCGKYNIKIKIKYHLNNKCMSWNEGWNWLKL